MKKNCSSHVGSFDSFRSKFFAKVISRFKSLSLRDIYELKISLFSLNEYDLRILSSVFMIEMFDLRGKVLKYAKELFLNHYGKSVQISVGLQDMWVELKL